MGRHLSCSRPIFVRTLRSLEAIAGGDESEARAWLKAPNAALFALPIDHMITVQEVVDVTTYLDDMRVRI